MDFASILPSFTLLNGRMLITHIHTLALPREATDANTRGVTLVCPNTVACDR
jgi:hypothetical protein